ncbi:MAG: hypothetical protein N0E56_14785 [Candidatus Thiodiazotropha endolucinida]|nr:hypothetical protein [Candidatus Thiodiazotropha endolucinida]
MNWRDYQVVRGGGQFVVPAGVTQVGIAAIGPGGRCMAAQGGLGGGGGGGFAYGVREVSPGEVLTGFVVDERSSRFGTVLEAFAGGDSVNERGGAGGRGSVDVPEDTTGATWRDPAVATGGHGGVGQRKGVWVSYGGGGGMGSFYGEGGNGGAGRLVGVASMFGHGGGGGLGGAGGASLAHRAMPFIDRQAVEDQAGDDKATWELMALSSGPGGGGGGGVTSGGAAWGVYGYLEAKRRAESLGGPGGGGGSDGPGDTGGVLYRPDGAVPKRLLATETPGKGGAGLRAAGGESRFHPGNYLANYLPHPVVLEDEGGTGERVRRSMYRSLPPSLRCCPDEAVDSESELARCQPALRDPALSDVSPGVPTVYFTSRSGEGRTVMAPYLALAACCLDGGGGTGANLSGAGHGGPGAGGGGAGQLPGYESLQGLGGLAGHGGFGGGGGGGFTMYVLTSEPGCVDGLPGGNGGVGGGGGGGGYQVLPGPVVFDGAGTGGPGGGGGGGPASKGGAGFFIVYW